MYIYMYKHSFAKEPLKETPYSLQSVSRALSRDNLAKLPFHSQSLGRTNQEWKELGVAMEEWVSFAKEP